MNSPHASDHSAAVENCLGKLDERGRLLIKARFGGEDDLPAVCNKLGVEKKNGAEPFEYGSQSIARLR